MRKSKIKAGDVFKTKEGDDVVVIEYFNRQKILIEFVDKYKHQTTVQGGNLVKGSIKNPYRPFVRGVGYFGVGEYKATSEKKITRAYNTWSQMLRRCYCPKAAEKHPAYKDVTVCEEWHNFQVFAEWFYKQPNHDKKGFELDKDLLVPYSKIYSPQTCSFVPKQINVLFTGKKNNGLPIGMWRHGNKYQVSVSNEGKETHFGTYSTIEEAEIVYKREKKKVLIEVVNKYKNDLNPQVYHNLLNWEFR